MGSDKQQSILNIIVRAPFYAAFVLVFYFLASGCFKLINGFALSLGFSATFIRIALVLFAMFFLFISLLILIKLFLKND